MRFRIFCLLEAIAPVVLDLIMVLLEFAFLDPAEADPSDE
jgi:hypothetical protein